MNCDEAKKLIDERIEAARTMGEGAKRGARSRFKPLAAHLAGCPACAAHDKAMCDTRERTRATAADVPTDEEITSMWTAIATAANLPAASPGSTNDATETQRSPDQGILLRFLAASTAAAAVLFAAAMIGRDAKSPLAPFMYRSGYEKRAQQLASAAPSALDPANSENLHSEPAFDLGSPRRESASIQYGYQVPFPPKDRDKSSGSSDSNNSRSDEDGRIPGIRFSGGPYDREDLNSVGEKLTGARFYGFDPATSVGNASSPILDWDDFNSSSQSNEESQVTNTGVKLSANPEWANNFDLLTSDQNTSSVYLNIENDDGDVSSMNRYFDASPVRNEDPEDKVVLGREFKAPGEDSNRSDDAVDATGDSLLSTEAPFYGGGERKFVAMLSNEPKEYPSPDGELLGFSLDGTIPPSEPARGQPFTPLDAPETPALASADKHRGLEDTRFVAGGLPTLLHDSDRMEPRVEVSNFQTPLGEEDYSAVGDRWDGDDTGKRVDSEARARGGRRGSGSAGLALADVEASKISLAPEAERYLHWVAPVKPETPATPTGLNGRATEPRLSPDKQGTVLFDAEFAAKSDESAIAPQPVAPPTLAIDWDLLNSAKPANGMNPDTITAQLGTTLAQEAARDANDDEPQAADQQNDRRKAQTDEAQPPATESQDQSPPAPPPDQSPQPQAQERTPAATRPKIIKTGDLSVEVASYETAVERIHDVVRRADAFIADGSTSEQAGGALVGVVVIRVVPEQFEALFDILKRHLGRVESENVKAADVTAEFVDLQARIRGMEITETRLQQLIKEKSFLDDVQSLLEVEREVTRVRSQIEQMQGQLRVMADRIGMSTIRVTLREPARTVPSASLSVEIPILESSARTLGDALKSIDGRLVSAKTAKRSDGTLKGDYELQVSLARFGDLLSAIESLGRVEQREVRDWQFGDADAPWAAEVQCRIALVLYERSRQLPSGSISVEVDDLTAAIDAMDPALGMANATVISNETTQRPDGSSEAVLKLRVPAGAFAEFVEALAPLGRTTDKQISGEAGSIVGGAASVLCDMSLTLAEPVLQVPSGRILIEVGAFPDARQRLSAIVAGKGVQVLASDSEQRSDGTWVGGFRLGIKASEMEPIVSQLEALGRVESRQIRGTGLGDLARVDPNAIAVVTLTLAEKAAIRPPVDQAGGAIRTQLRGALEGLYKSLGYILYGLVVLAPWLIIVLTVGWLTTRVWKRRKQRPPSPARASAS